MDKLSTTRTRLNRFGSFLRWGSNLLLVAGVAALAIYCFVWTEAHFFQAYASRHFDLESKASATRMQLGYGDPVPGKVTSSGQPVRNDSLIGKLKIDRLGISVIVLEGVEDDTLRIAAGHVPDTAFPGQSGNVAIAAHRDTFFRPLENIRANDKITLETDTGAFQYQVDAIWVVAPERVEVLDPTPKPALTLVTCYPFHFVGSAPYRFIVRAHQIASILVPPHKP